MKMCGRCGQEKPEAEFHGRWRSNDKLQAWCSPCHSEYAAAYYLTVRDKRLADYRANAAAIQHSRRLRRYQMSEQEFTDRWEVQGGRCAVCESSKNLQVDHDHDCCPGKESCGMCVRGLLCPSCNKALGFARNDIGILNSLMVYVARHNQQRSNA